MISINSSLVVRLLIHGGGQGVCAAAEGWRLNAAAVVRYLPDWVCFGKKADAARNAFMLEDSRPVLVTAFPRWQLHDRGVRSSIALAAYSVPARRISVGSRIVPKRNTSGLRAA
jgi:hypothetical protein